MRRVRRVRRDISAGHRVGRAENPRDGNYRRVGDRPPRSVCRRGRLLQLHRQYRHRDRAAEVADQEQPRLYPGGRRSGRGFRSGRGIRRVGDQGSRDGASAPGRARFRSCGKEVTSMAQNGKAIRLVMIDNYDSFTYNLVQYLGELGAEVTVKRNDAIDVAGVRALRPNAVVISPGPCTPAEAGISLALLREMAGEVPILGVCLGHQCIGEAFGGKVVRAPRLMHGKTSPVIHDGNTIFAGLPSPFDAMRYHSLIVDPDSLPSALEVSARTAENEIMALRHKELAVEGVQFHPESILTTEGKHLLKNFLDRVDQKGNAQ